MLSSHHSPPYINEMVISHVTYPWRCIIDELNYMHLPKTLDHGLLGPNSVYYKKSIYSNDSFFIFIERGIRSLFVA